MTTAPYQTIDGVTVTAIVQATTTTILIAGYSVLANDIGNLIKITGGTGLAGTYQITAVNTGTNIYTLDKSAGTVGQTLTGKSGWV